MGLTTTGGSTTSGDLIEIIDATHPVADGPGATLDGTVELTASAQPLGTAGTSTIGPDAQIVATLDATPTSATVAAYDAGDTLADTTTAAGIRVLAGLSQDALVDLTADGDALLHNLIAWTLEESLAFGDGRRPPIAVIIGGDDGPNPDGWSDGDLAIQARLEAAGWTTSMHQDHFGSKGGYFNLIIISESADPALVHTHFRDSTAPVIVMDPELWDDMGLTTAPGTATTVDTLDVLDAAHPVADGPAGALAGTLEVTTAPTGWNYVDPDDLTDSATPVITTTGNSDQVVAAAVQVGTALVDDTTAAGPRVLLGMTDQAVTNLDADGWALFDNTVDWARHAYDTQTPGPTVDTDLFDYDPDGRLTSDGNNTYTYDAAGRLTARTLAGETPIEVGYGYTGDGVLVDLSVNDGVTTDTYDLTWDPIPAVPQIAQWTSSTDDLNLIRGLGLTGTTGTIDDWTARDHLGSITSGPLALSAAYDPWGNPAATGTTPGVVGLGYRSELTIAGDIHLRARNYNPNAGRFTTVDPIDGTPGTPDESNPYDYVGNSPHNYTDPHGLCRVADVTFEELSTPAGTWEQRTGPPGTSYDECRTASGDFSGVLCGQVNNTIIECKPHEYNSFASVARAGFDFLVFDTSCSGWWCAIEVVSVVPIARPLRYVDEAADLARAGRRTPRAVGPAGDAAASTPSATQPFLRGSAGNAGRVPASVRSALEGQTFTSREAFRSAFWRAAADDPAIASQFSRSNQALMRSGRAPIAPSSQHYGGRMRYELHHITPVSRGGGVYDLDNIVVVTPRYHAEVLSSSYHYGGGG